MFASELFGYKKGAFTDAKSDKEGLLVAANGGSIFLDEIDSLSLKSQTALLRLLQESEFRPVGSSQTVKANVRIIAAANCDLNDKIAKGEFRQDLYFRLFILSIKMPPLRERKEDIELLVTHFIDKLNRQYGLARTSICPRLLSKLKGQDWPGNVRELENTIHRYYLLSGSSVISETPAIPMDAPYQVSSQPQMVESQVELDTDTDDGDLDFCDAKRRAIEAFEQRFVTRVLNKAKGNVTKAASLCGKERRAFGKLVKKYNIDRENLHL